MSRGHTLLEAAAVLALLAVALSVVAPGARRLQDEAAVRASRERVVALLAQARLEAVARGGALLHLDVARATAVVVAGADTLRSVALGEAGVRVDAGRRGELEIAYDAVGVGRPPGATLRFRRGAAERALVVSAFGRVRRR